MSVDKLGEELGVMPVTIRAHVGVLERDQLVQGCQQRTGRAGRPSIVYTLTDDAQNLFPKRYDNLASGILDNIKKLHGQETVVRVIEKLGEDMAEAHADRIQGKDMDGKVEEAAQLLNEEGSLATWEKRDDNYVLTLHNCPYLHVAEHRQEICGMEVAFLKKALSTDVKLEESVVSGAINCVFTINGK